MNNPLFVVDKSISRVLNEWGAREFFLIKVLSNYIVFLVIAIALFWLINRSYQHNKPRADFKLFLKKLFSQGVILLVIPVGVSTAISEIISSIYVRQRPFVTMNDVKLLVPHGADGGMPSHHMVFMVSIAVIIYFFNKRLSFLLIILSVISGIARISAGIHYPSDVLAGAFAGGVIAIIYARIMFRGKRNFISLK